jgi:hypothetical protein
LNIFQRIFQKHYDDLPVIVVSGLPRSGTSLMMMMLNSAGIPPVIDGERSADEDNPKGYFEFERVKRLKDGDFDWVFKARGKVVKVISALLPYLPNQLNYKALFMLRSLDEILASQRMMLIRRGEDPEKISDAEMADRFRDHLAHTKDWLAQQPNFSTLYVHYNRLIEEPEPIVRDINRFLGGKLDEKLMTGKIDPKLYRQRKKS